MMYAVTDEFKKTLLQPHRVVSYGEIYSGSVLQTLPDGSTLLPISSGSVEYDLQSETQRRCALTLSNDGSLVPSTKSDLLLPYGNEIKLYRGLVRYDREVEVVPLGVFGITSLDIEDAETGVNINIEGYDRSRRISRNKFVTPFLVTAGQTYGSAIKSIINSRFYGVPYNFSDDSRTLVANLTFPEEDDPWEACQLLASLVGNEVYFDGTGTCVMRKVPDPVAQAPVWDYAEGDEAIILGLSKRHTTEDAYNHVIVKSDSTRNVTPIRGEAFDNDPESPFAVTGPLGDVPYFLTVSNPMTDSLQAEDAAAAILVRILGLSEEVSFPTMVNAAHEPGDVITISRARTKVGQDYGGNVYILDKFSVPLEVSGTLTATTRRRRRSL